ncbi:MAG: RNA polymerase subunit sigma [Clostridia bacterium]|nr:RNA polymerase subunit sigma [Clostridia bacterium]
MTQKQTRHSEIRQATSDPNVMLGLYIAAPVYKTWIEDFVDEVSGEVVSIDRKELLFSVGQYISADLLANIMFYQNSGDITSPIEVSNQKREASIIKRDGLYPWSVKAKIGKKSHRFLLYACDINMAIEVAKDHIELNYTDRFEILTAKSFSECIMINDALSRIEAEQGDDTEKVFDMKFYKIETRVVMDQDDSLFYTFVIFAKDVDTAMVRIQQWISKKLKERREERGEHEPLEFSTAIESAVQIPCSGTIDKDFSLPYLAAKTEL